MEHYFKFIYGVECEVQAENKEIAFLKMKALMQEETCVCEQIDCVCITEGQIGIWDLDSLVKND